ncbi:MAG: CHAT domain-containing protein [Raineya sp.]|jgi:ankyrin repeat protein|nr:CHAT domain-containing protein [Raineya sp.]
MHFSKKLFLSLFLISFSFFLKAQDINENLLEAVQENNFTKVQEYISKGADVNFKDENNASILLWATYKMNLPAVKFLVSKGAKVLKEDGCVWLDDKKVSYYGSLLAVCASENKLDMLKYFIEEHKIPIDSKEFSPYDNQYIGWTALQWASYKGYTNIVGYLIKNKANINNYQYKESPLYYALTNKWEAVALMLMQNGADAKPKDHNGYSPLYLATFYDLKEVVKAIINKKGYDIASENLLETALERGNLEIFEMFVKKKMPLDKTFRDGSSALHQAAKNGYTEIVQLLISKKFPINQTDKSGNTALMYAAYNNQTKICKVLIEKGIDKNLKNNQGQVALDFAKTRNFSETIDFLEKGIYKEPDTWQSLNQDAVRYYNQGKIDKASETMEKACFYVAQKSGEDSEDYATALHNFARLKKNVGNYQVAETLLLKAMKIREKNKSEKLGVSLNELADNFYAKGYYEKSLEYYLKLLKLQTENTFEYATTLDNIGRLHYLNNSFKASEDAYNKSLHILKTLNKENSFDYAITLSNLGSLLQDMTRYNEAKSVYRQSLKIFETQYQKPEYNVNQHLTVISNYADILVAMGEYNAAEYYFKEKILNNIPENKEFSNKAIVLNNLGVLYLQTNRLEGAENYLKQSLDLKRKSLGENHPKYWSTQSSLGNVYLMKKEYDKAEKVYKQILKLSKKAVSEKNAIYLNTLNSLADLYFETSRYNESESMYLKLLELSKDSKDTRKNEYASYLHNTGMFYRNIKKYNTAENYLREAHSIRKQVLGDKHLLYYYSVSGLALFYFDTGNMREAYKLFKESNELALYLIRKNIPYMSEKGRGEFTSDFQEYYVHFTEFALEYSKQDISILGDLYNLRLATKALLLNTETDFYKKAQNITDSATVNFYKSYLKEKDKIYKLQTTFNAELSDWATLQNQMDVVEKMEASLNMYFSIKKDTSLQNASWKDLQKKLQPHEVAIEVVRLAKMEDKKKEYISYVFLILKPQGLPEVLKIEKGEDLEISGLKYFLNAIKYKKEDKFSYNLYWAKIAEKIKGFKTVYLSADHIYTQISLNTLKNTATNKYVSDEVDIILFNNLKELLVPKNNNKKVSDAVFFGYPSYQLDKKGYLQALNNLKNNNKLISENEDLALAYNNTRDFSNLALNTLPGTKIEVETIEEMFKKKGIKTQLFMAENALEEAIKNIKSPKVLHIATHGYFLSDIATSKDSEKILGIRKSVLAKNVLMRSGLMLAGAESNLKSESSSEIENGILTAQEAMNLNLTETELVVLSACETGLGEIKTGEGVYGLQRAFKVAGAKAILMSLWKVDDEATKELMISFYDNWLKTNNKKQAFKLAQAKLRTKFPHPYYWGAFILIGE